jgi:hypothetical protein
MVFSNSDDVHIIKKRVKRHIRHHIVFLASMVLALYVLIARLSKQKKMLNFIIN